LQDQRDKIYVGEDKNQGSAKEKLTEKIRILMNKQQIDTTYYA
jgi:hypothetical protein